MTDSKHTPGPWTVSRVPDASFPGEEDQFDIYSDHDGGNLVAEVGDVHGDVKQNQQAANARLIAAAPAMYKALEYFAGFMPEGVAPFSGSDPGDSIPDDSEEITITVTVGALREACDALTQAGGTD